MTKLQEVAELKSVPAPHFEDEQPCNWNVWVSKIDGSFMCPEGYTEDIEKLLNRGIVDFQNTGNGAVANIGFNPTEQKWYGWSHRAICGFKVGDSVKKGDVAYMPANEQDEIESIVAFWDKEEYQEDFAWILSDKEGQKGVQMTYKYTADVPNEKLAGAVGERFYPLTERYGKGEWVAETLEDAKQMAKDFADNIS